MNIKTSVLLAAVAFCALGTPAMASDLCKPYDKSQWLSRDEITRKAQAMGVEIRKIQPEDGCWEVKGMKDGKRIEAYFDPVSAELVLTK